MHQYMLKYYKTIIYTAITLFATNCCNAQIGTTDCFCAEHNKMMINAKHVVFDGIGLVDLASITKHIDWQLDRQNTLAKHSITANLQFASICSIGEVAPANNPLSFIDKQFVMNAPTISNAARMKVRPDGGRPDEDFDIADCRNPRIDGEKAKIISALFVMEIAMHVLEMTLDTKRNHPSLYQ